MRLATLVSAVLALQSLAALASPLDTGRRIEQRQQHQQRSSEPTTCAVIKERKEWRSLDADEKVSYIAAVKCLKTTAPREPNIYEGVRSLFDQFQAEHVRLMLFVHWAGQFLPFHRYYLHKYEEALEACGYSGGQPYWSWSIDVERGSMEQNEMFSDETGFGGNGEYDPERQSEPTDLNSFEWPLVTPVIVANASNTTTVPRTGTGGGCVTGGPFSESQGWFVNVGLGDSTTYNPHCLTRDFDFSQLSTGNRSQIEECLAMPDFGAFTRKAEARFGTGAPNIHSSGHRALGGEMRNFFSSPGDPLFYLHHANLDRVWWKWQKLDLPARLHQIGSNLVSIDYNNTLALNTTLGYEVDIGAIGPPITVHELLDTSRAGLCYRYADPPASI